MSQRCQFARQGPSCVCPVCGLTITTGTDCGKVHASCKPDRAVKKLTLTRKPGWGDTAESLLKRVGITKRRYKRLKLALGLKPSCGCSGRKAWLNRLGEWVRTPRK